MRVLDIEDGPPGLEDPADPAWAAVPAETVALVPVPLDLQPNEYIRNAWRSRPYGRVRQVEVATAKRGDRLFVRLEWADSEEPNTEFLDGAGVFFPDAAADGPPVTIGTHSAPVRLWSWRDRLDVQRSLPAMREFVASGPGVFRPPAGGSTADEVTLEASSGLTDGRWAVVLSGGYARAAGGRMGVVVWDGANEERAGIGSVTEDWLPLVAEPASQG